MDEISTSNNSTNSPIESPTKINDFAESTEIKNDDDSDNANENSDDGCVDSEEEIKSDAGEADVNDDRSQTPLQDEVESYQAEKLENAQLDFNAGEVDNEEIEGSQTDIKENIAPSDLNGIQVNEKTTEEASSKTEFKENELNDDHGELDYEEDLDDNKVTNKLIESSSDDISESGELDSNNNKAEKEESAGKVYNSSDGELLEEEDCEEGEIKEAGSRRHYQRPLCRFYTRGSCTWGLNCRFLHPGINDKGNYSMLSSFTATATMPPPIRAPHFSNIHERLGSRTAVPHMPTEVLMKDGEHKDTPESAWERGLRHAKEIRKKTKPGDQDEVKKDTSPVSSPSLSPTNHNAPSHLAPPPPRDAFFDDIHRPMHPIMPGMPPLHPMHMMGNPMEGWPYRPPHHHDMMMRWPRPPQPHLHPPHDFQPFHQQYDYRMQGRDTRFNSSQRGRFERFKRPDNNFNRGKPEEWKDPWSRTKTNNSKKKSSSSRSRSGKRSRTSYSSFTSSSYSSRSGSGSSYSSSRSSSRSSSSRSRSRSKSPVRRHNKKAAVPVARKNNVMASRSKLKPKVIAPSMAEMTTSPSHKPFPTKQKVPVNLPTATPKPTLPPKPIFPKTVIAPTPKVVVPPTPTPVAPIQAPIVPPPVITAPVVFATPVLKELPSLKSPMHITMATKPVKNLSKTNQLQAVGKSVAEAFKEDEDEERQRKKPRLSKFSSDENLSGNKPAGLPHKSSQNKLLLANKNKLPTKFSRSKESSESGSSYTSSSSSSSSSSSRHSKRYSNMASPISSDSSASPSKQKSKQDRLRLVKPPTEALAFRPHNSFERNGTRGVPHRGARTGDHMQQRRQFRPDNFSQQEPPQRPPQRRPDFHRPPTDLRANHPPEMRNRGEDGRKQTDLPPRNHPVERQNRDFRDKEDEDRGDFYRYGDERAMKEQRSSRDAMYSRGVRGGRYQERRDDFVDRRVSPLLTNKDLRYPNHFPTRSSKELSQSVIRKRTTSPMPGKEFSKGVEETMGRMDRRMDDRTDGMADIRTDGRADRGMEIRTDGRTDNRPDGRTDRGVEGRMDNRMERGMERRMDERMDGRGGGQKGGKRHDRREELLMQLKAVEDAIAKKKNRYV